MVLLKRYSILLLVILFALGCSKTEESANSNSPTKSPAASPTSESFATGEDVLNEALRFSRSNRLTESAEVCRKHMGRFPEYWRLRAHLGMVLIGMEKADEALPELKAAYELAKTQKDPVAPSLQLNISRAHLDLKQYQEGVDAATIAIDGANFTEPALSALALSYRADNLMGLEKFDEAVSDYQKAVNLDSSNPNLRLQCADALIAAGKGNVAKGFLMQFRDMAAKQPALIEEIDKRLKKL